MWINQYKILKVRTDITLSELKLMNLPYRKK